MGTLVCPAQQQITVAPVPFGYLKDCVLGVLSVSYQWIGRGRIQDKAEANRAVE